MKSLDFWQRILNNFQSSPDDSYICHSSAEFKFEWKDHLFRDECRKLVIEFLEYLNVGEQVISDYRLECSCSCQDDTLIGLGILFDHNINESRRGFRLSFLNWLVRKLSVDSQ